MISCLQRSEQAKPCHPSVARSGAPEAQAVRSLLGLMAHLRRIYFRKSKSSDCRERGAGGGRGGARAAGSAALGTPSPHPGAPFYIGFCLWPLVGRASALLECASPTSYVLELAHQVSRRYMSCRTHAHMTGRRFIVCANYKVFRPQVRPREWAIQALLDRRRPSELAPLPGNSHEEAAQDGSREASPPQQQQRRRRRDRPACSPPRGGDDEGQLAAEPAQQRRGRRKSAAAAPSGANDQGDDARCHAHACDRPRC